MKSAPLHGCNNSSWPGIPSQQGKLDPANYTLHRPETTRKVVAAATEGTASCKENTFFTKDYFQTITQSLLKQWMLFKKEEVHKDACEEWHKSRNSKTKQLGKVAKKWHSQKRMKLRIWNKHLVLKQKELETKKTTTTQSKVNEYEINENLSMKNNGSRLVSFTFNLHFCKSSKSISERLSKLFWFCSNINFLDWYFQLLSENFWPASTLLRSSSLAKCEVLVPFSVAAELSKWCKTYWKVL